MGRPKQNIMEKVQKELPEFASNADSMTAEQINAKLADLAKGVEDVEIAKESDMDLEKAREHASQLAAPYRESLKVIKLKSRYLIKVLQSRGQ